MRRRSDDNLWLPGMGGAAVALEPADAWEREQALDVRRSFIVQAPAGSGKTELLIQRFLALLPTVAEPESIVAITFTIKAAAEMRGRVLDALRTAASGREPEASHERATFRLASEALRRDRKQGWGLLSNPGRLADPDHRRFVRLHHAPDALDGAAGRDAGGCRGRIRTVPGGGPAHLPIAEQRR